MELDYPRDMSMWKGVPYNIDAVFQHINGTFSYSNDGASKLTLLFNF